MEKRFSRGIFHRRGESSGCYKEVKEREKGRGKISNELMLSKRTRLFLPEAHRLLASTETLEDAFNISLWYRKKAEKKEGQRKMRRRCRKGRCRGKSKG